MSTEASHRLRKYLKVAPTADHCIPLSFAGAEVTIGELQQILDERAIARDTVKEYAETIDELNERLANPSRREMRLQEQLDRIGTDEAVAQMKARARAADEVWQVIPPQYHNKDRSLKIAVNTMAYHLNRQIIDLKNRNAALLTTINEAAGRSADEADSGVSLIKQARAYQKKRHPEGSANRQQLFYAAFALLTDTPDGYPFGHSSWQGIARRGRKNQLAHAGACIAALIDRLPDTRVLGEQP